MIMILQDFVDEETGRPDSWNSWHWIDIAFAFHI